MSWTNAGVSVNPIYFSDSHKKAASSPESVQLAQVLFAPTSEHLDHCISHNFWDIMEIPSGNTHGYIVGDRKQISH